MLEKTCSVAPKAALLFETQGILRKVLLADPDRIGVGLFHFAKIPAGITWLLSGGRTRRSLVQCARCQHDTVELNGEPLPTEGHRLLEPSSSRIIQRNPPVLIVSFATLLRTAEHSGGSCVTGRCSLPTPAPQLNTQNPKEMNYCPHLSRGSS